MPEGVLYARLRTFRCLLTRYSAMLKQSDIFLNCTDDQLNAHASVQLAILRRGQSFGESALEEGGLRSATVRAGVDGTLLLRINRASLLDPCNKDPQLGYVVMRNLAENLALKVRTTDLRMRVAQV